MGVTCTGVALLLGDFRNDTARRAQSQEGLIEGPDQWVSENTRKPLDFVRRWGSCRTAGSR